jgi:hypothetical protein
MATAAIRRRQPGFLRCFLGPDHLLPEILQDKPEPVLAADSCPSTKKEAELWVMHADMELLRLGFTTSASGVKRLITAPI